MSKKIKETRKTSSALEKLRSMTGLLEYYLSNTEQWKTIQKDVKFIEDHLIDLSAEKKVDHARLANKFRKMFFKENAELKQENAELKQEIKELKDD